MGSRRRFFGPAHRGAAAVLAFSLALVPAVPMPCAAAAHGGHEGHAIAIPVSRDEGPGAPDGAATPCALAGSCRGADVIAAPGRAPLPAEATEAPGPGEPDRQAPVYSRRPDTPPPRA